MITRIAHFISSIADWKILTVAIIVYIIFGAYVMPSGANKFKELSGGKDIKILDLQFSYSPDSARVYLADYTPEARDYAIKFGLGADSFYPIAYTFLLVVIVALIFKSPDPTGTLWRNVHLYPSVILVVDYLENIAVASLHFNYPDIANWQIRLASSLTSLKWCLVILLIPLLVYGFIRKFIAKKA